MLKPLERDTLTKQAADTLRHFILTEGLAAESQLPSERDLSDMLCVSRNIVREALTILVTEGLIVKRAGRGIFVTDFDPMDVVPQLALTVDYSGRNLVELAEARAAVELGAVDLMVARITAQQLERLDAVNRRLAANLRHRRSTIKDDIEFHTLLFEATHNPVLIELVPLLVEFFRLAVVHRPTAMLHNPERIIDEHEQIIHALRLRDPQKTRDALLDHFHLDRMAELDPIPLPVGSASPAK